MGQFFCVRLQLKKFIIFVSVVCCFLNDLVDVYFIILSCAVFLIMFEWVTLLISLMVPGDVNF